MHSGVGMHFHSGLSKGCFALFAAAFFLALGMTSTGGAVTEQYVEYENFMKFSKKAHAGASVQIMAKDLTRQELEECYQCHVTGFGKPGGFVSFEETPHMADAGCETCHGPGYDHIESGGEIDLIKGDLELADCEGCHNPDRVDAFDFKPLLFGGAH